MKNSYLLLFIFSINISCKNCSEVIPAGNDFLFNNPQPINDSELSKIPNKFHGIYINSDSIYLNINAYSIVEEKYNRFKIHKTALDSLKNEFDIISGTLISKVSKEIYSQKIIGDSIELSNKFMDTVFTFSKTQKAKRVNGQFIISEKDSLFWKIKSIILDKNILKIKYLYSDNDLIRMDSITKIKSKMIDSTSFIISPNRPEFVKIINLKHFGYNQDFKKMK